MLVGWHMASCKQDYFSKWRIFLLGIFMTYFNILGSKGLVHWVEPIAQFGRSVYCRQKRRNGKSWFWNLNACKLLIYDGTKLRDYNFFERNNTLKYNVCRQTVLNTLKSLSGKKFDSNFHNCCSTTTIVILLQVHFWVLNLILKRISSSFF